MAGLATLLVFPPIGWPAVAWIAFVPWLLGLNDTTTGRSIVLSSLFAVTIVLPLGAWIPEVAVDEFGASPLAAHLLWLLTSLSYAPAIVALGTVLARVSVRSAAYPLAAGAGWALVELSHAFVWPEIPWVVVGATQIDTPVSAMAAISGVHSVSAVVVTLNAWVVQALRGCPVRQLLLELVVGGLVVGAGTTTGRAYSLAESDRILRIAVVQPGVRLTGRGDSRSPRATLDAAVSAIGDVRGPSIFFLPENMLNATVEGRPDLIARLAALASDRNAAFVFGVHRRSDAGRLNSVAVLEPGRPVAIVYDKRRLLPIAEMVPGWLGPGLRRSLGRLVPHRSFKAGSVSLPVSGLPARVELAICYEAAFSGRPDDPRSELLVNPVNDSWYDSTPAAQHLLLLSRWRAIERAAPLVRAALTGISAVVASDGSIDASISIGEAGALSMPVALRSTTTPFERAGHAPIVAVAIVSVVAALRSRAGAYRAARR